VDVWDSSWDTDSTVDVVQLIPNGLLQEDSFGESVWPSLDDSCLALAASRSTSSFSWSMLVRSQRAISNGSNRRGADTSHQHRSARRMTAGSGTEGVIERAAERAVTKVAFVSQELDTDEVRGIGCQ